MHIRALDLHDAGWFKSSYSDNQGGACVEGAFLRDGNMGIRDSKDPSGLALVIRPGAWASFIAGVRTGKLYCE